MQRLLFSLIFFFSLHFGFAQTFEGVFSGNLKGDTYVLKIKEQGELVMGDWLDASFNQKGFVGKKENKKVIGVIGSEESEHEITATLDKQMLSLVFVADGSEIQMKRLSKNLDYDLTKVFPDASGALREQIIGIWILKEQYKVENGEKVFSKLTGKDYMTAINPDGKYVLDIRGFRDAEEEANTPQQFRMKASDFYEMSQMFSWKLVGNSIHIFPTQPIPGVQTNLVRSIEFENEKMIFKDSSQGWIEVYERKK
ncbi:hypothetical protein [Shivajiella indica]|uniref:Lipocalin-like domain-containing protein n=1 Tax=Shivajiella indica TaxID=872115 RepID=A0ABW5BFX6_9BACT